MFLLLPTLEFRHYVRLNRPEDSGGDALRRIAVDQVLSVHYVSTRVLTVAIHFGIENLDVEPLCEQHFAKKSP